MTDAKPAFYANGKDVFKSPVHKNNEDGSTSISIGFPVCKTRDAVNPEDVVKVLIAGEKYEALAIELAETKAELDVAKAAIVIANCNAANLIDHVVKLDAELQSRDATIATMREALQPFASAAYEVENIPDGECLSIEDMWPPCGVPVAVGDLRKAKAAYDASTGGEG